MEQGTEQNIDTQTNQPKILLRKTSEEQLFPNEEQNTHTQTNQPNILLVHNKKSLERQQVKNMDKNFSCHYSRSWWEYLCLCN